MMQTPNFTILVVEDSADDQLMIKRAFQKAGVTTPIHFVGGGEEAIEYLNGKGQFADRQKFQYPSFIMTDLKMPKVDGFGVLENLKKNPLWAVIPTVVLSASLDENDVKTAYQLGASSYHVKPSDFTILQKLIKLLYEYWMTCRIPRVDTTGKQLPTKYQGKLGERFSNPPESDKPDMGRDEF